MPHPSGRRGARAGESAMPELTFGYDNRNNRRLTLVVIASAGASRSVAISRKGNVSFGMLCHYSRPASPICLRRLRASRNGAATAAYNSRVACPIKAALCKGGSAVGGGGLLGIP